jgi:hypothetical protein
MVLQFLHRNYHRLDGAHLPNPEELALMIANADNPLVIAVQKEGQYPELAALVWYEEQAKYEKYRGEHVVTHIILDERYKYYAKRVFGSWWEYEQENFPERKIIIFNGCKENTAYKWLNRQGIGSLHWIPRSMLNPHTGEPTDYWEYVIHPKRRVKIETNPVQTEESVNDVWWKEKTYIRPDGGQAQELGVEPAKADPPSGYSYTFRTGGSELPWRIHVQDAKRSG